MAEVTELVAGRALVPGTVEADSLCSEEPLSFWGGYDHTTGEIIDHRHPLRGAAAAGKILVLPLTRGSSTTTAVFLEAVRRGTAPAGIVTDGIDRFLTLASVVADEMYGKPVPVVAVGRDDFRRLLGSRRLRIDADGTVHVLR